MLCLLSRAANGGFILLGIGNLFGIFSIFIFMPNTLDGVTRSILIGAVRWTRKQNRR